MYEFLYDNSLAVVLTFSLGAILLGLSLSRKRTSPDIYRDLARDETHIDKNSVTTFAKIPERKIGKRRELAATYAPPKRKPIVTLSPRQIERVNIVRKQQGRAPLNQAGLRNAVSTAWDTPRREPVSTNDWLTYLILYEVFWADHKSSYCGAAGGITIDPEKPYNGAGGEYGGAGASGDWTSAPASVTAVAGGIAVGASAAYLETHLRSDDERQADAVVSTYQRSEAAFDTPAPRSEPMPEPAPQSRPDPTPSYSSSDSSSSSSSSSSYDSGSSSSDSGGGGGGGGGD